MAFQLTIQARDLGSPPLISNQNARVTVNVARNLNSPKFEATPYTATIDRNAATGTLVKQVRARDTDENVRLSIYSQK